LDRWTGHPPFRNKVGIEVREMEESLNEVAISAAKKLEVDDAVALTSQESEKMVRFANNSLTVAKNMNETGLYVYLGWKKRRVVAATSNPQRSNVVAFVRKLYDSLRSLPEGSDYAELPGKAYRYHPKGGGYDKKIEGIETEMSEFAVEAIESAKANGGERSAGALVASVSNSSILTSNGTRGHDRGASITLNIRSFSEGDASGHGLSCASRLSDFEPAEAGRSAGENAKKMVGASEPEAGEYEVLMSPTVSANLISIIGGFASAFSVEAGISYLGEKIGKRVASENFGLTDHGQMDGALDGRIFDDEGMPTRTISIIKDGILETYLHNLTTAKKSGMDSTGNAGAIDPHPWNLEVRGGDSSYDEMVGEMKRGVVLTSNWYTRFKNYKTGEFSTVPRDGAYLVEGGKVVRGLKGLRLSDSLERIFSSTRLISRSREWIEWWEVDTPTLTPWILVDGVKITRAYE
jgi:PmbA protein